MKTATTYLGQDMDVVETQEIAGGCAAVYSARCPGKETVNEDGAALIPVGGHGAVLAVADGLGGAQAGDLAARITIETLRCSIEEASHDPRPLRAAILDGIEQANREVQARGVGAATTLAVAEIDGGVFRPYHVGDSVILLMGGRGKVKLQTVSHSPVGFGVEAGLLDADEAIHHEDRHIVSNVVGIPDMRIEIGSPIRFAARDTLVLASDGLVDNLTTGEIVECLRAGSLSRSAWDMASKTLRRMTTPLPGLPCKPDDLTFVVFRLNTR